jgi:enterochelin esterase-like enzyme
LFEKSKIHLTGIRVPGDTSESIIMRLIIIAIVVLLLTLGLSSCQVQETPSIPQVTPTYTPFQAVSPTPSPTVSPTPTLVPTATPVPCLEESGRFEDFKISFQPGQPFTFRVYTPPCFDPESQVRYPVLYMIHGQTFAHDQWGRLGIGDAADALITSGKSVPFLMVMPREDDTFSDIYSSVFSRDLISGLVPWIDENYPTCSQRQCRAIGGLSRGGAWALRLGFVHWDLFGAVGLHSTPPFIGDPQKFVSWLREIPEDQMPRVYMDTGRGDAYIVMTTAFENLLVQLDVPHEWYLFNGRHDEEYWSSHVSDYLEWYTRPWNAAAQAPD